MTLLTLVLSRDAASSGILKDMEASASIAAGRLPRDEGQTPHRALARRVERRISRAMLIAHLVGAADVFALLFGVLPSPVPTADANLALNLAAIAVYIPLATLVGMMLGARLSPERYAWICESRPPTAPELEAALKVPLRCLRLDAGLWLGGIVLFAAINVSASPALAGHIATTIALGGLTTCAIAYLLVEKLSRPIVELALRDGPPPRPAGPGVKGRMVLAWGAASGVPALGLVLVGWDGLTNDTVSKNDVALSALALGGIGLVLGLGVMLVAARTVSRPLGILRHALARVEAGDMSVHVPVDDASEVGLLQTGFNRMAAGLRERDRMQDLFSRQVGEDVVREILDGDPHLGGEVHEVAVLFVDLIGSTSFAVNSPPEHVVGRLNRFFAHVVDVIEEHGGWVNKFEGDAALCVFGAPAAVDDPAGCALAAARALRERIATEMPSADAGIGLSAGPAVAGWVGAERRFEYTVIGDPVNEASRLCDLAKGAPGRLLASEAIVSRALNGEGELWSLGEETLLRGREAPTRLAVPVGGQV